MIKIGQYGELTVADARKRARHIRERVSLGENPKEDWDALRAELTIQDLFQLTWDKHWNTPRYRESEWAREVNYSYKRHIGPSFGSFPLSQLTSSCIRNWHAGIKFTPIAANKALNVLARMFQFAEEQEIRDQNTNPCKLVKRHPERKRKRYATPDEIQKIGRILARESASSPAAVAFLYILMYSGSRPRAIERATWDELKFLEIKGETYGILTFRGKTSADMGDDETVVLPPQAMQMINKLPRVEGATITGTNMPSRFWRKVREEAGCKDLWARDLRRTFATIGMSGGIERGTIGELLNHRNESTTMIYAKIMDTVRIDAATKIANRIEGMLGASKAI